MAVEPGHGRQRSKNCHVDPSSAFASVSPRIIIHIVSDKMGEKIKGRIASFIRHFVHCKILNFAAVDYGVQNKL